MADHLEQYLQDAVPPVPDDITAHQRIALDQFVRLSADAVGPAIEQIRQRYETAQKKAARILEQRRLDIQSRLKSVEDAAEGEYRDELERIADAFETASNALSEDVKATRDRINDESEAAVADARKTYEEEVWLAESIADAARKKLEDEFALIRGKEIPRGLRRLKSLSEKAAWALHRYEQAPPPDPPPPARETPQAGDDPIAAFRRQLEAFGEEYQAAKGHLHVLERLWLPRLLVGPGPYVLLACIGLAAVALMGAATLLEIPHWPSFAYTGPAAFGITTAAGLLAIGPLWRLGRSKVVDAYLPLRASLARAKNKLDQRLELAGIQRQHLETLADEKRAEETREARQRLDGALANIEKRREARLREIEEKESRARAEIESQRDEALRKLDAEHPGAIPDARRQSDRESAEAEAAYEHAIRACGEEYNKDRARLEERFRQRLSPLESLLEAIGRLGIDPASHDAAEPVKDPASANALTPIVPFGHFEVDPNRLADDVRPLASFETGSDRALQLPAFLALPDRCSLLIETSRGGRDESIRTLRAVMVRLLTSLPPGRAHFTIIDPVGLGENFAGFMHLADYDEAMVGGRIWTDRAHIEQRLTDLTNHMENVIQKYLRNEFDTINEYNEQAGELAEPYRFLVIANFPTNFNEDAARRLTSILTSGPRCGVYTLIAYDARQDLPPGIHPDDLRQAGVHLLYEEDRFVWQDDVLRHFPLSMDEPPPEAKLTAIMHRVGSRAKDAKRVEVPFEVIAPSEDQCWSRDSRDDLDVAIGRTGATRLQHLRLGHGVAQHALVGGKTGSGKSTLLHGVITNLALWYGPDQVEFYLVDFKKGVEFKTYVTHALPHARAIAIESDREFGLSVLQRLDEEMEHRGRLFRQAGVQDLGAYRQTTGQVVPRTLLIVDEFQIFFSEDDKLAQDAAILLDRLVRQGRAFGLHALLGSQTLGGAAGLARSTIGQMAVRIALQCSEADSQLILSDDNVAARLLSRPGEAIYNDAGGLVQGNSPFQTAWLSDEQRDGYLRRVLDLAGRRGLSLPPPVVFEGSAPADISKNRLLADLITNGQAPASAPSGRVWLGEAVAIKDPTSVTLRRQSGGNLLIIGQRDDAALAMLASAMISLSAQHGPSAARFVVLDASPTDSSHAGVLKNLAGRLPHESQLVEYRQVAEAVTKLGEELRTRQEADHTDAPRVYVILFGLQRMRILRRQEDDFSFSTDDAEKPPRPDKLFADLLREGPPLGMHVLAWVDTPAALERTLDRTTVSEFDNRVLFQMSATDSANLIDSADANKLGHYRALVYSEEQGRLEKFRPYALPSPDWLTQVEKKLAHRSAAKTSDGVGR